MGLSGKTCHSFCPAAERKSANSNALGPKSPTPKRLGREVQCNRMPLHRGNFTSPKIRCPRWPVKPRAQPPQSWVMSRAVREPAARRKMKASFPLSHVSKARYGAPIGPMLGRPCAERSGTHVQGRVHPPEGRPLSAPFYRCVQGAQEVAYVVPILWTRGHL